MSKEKELTDYIERLCLSVEMRNTLLVKIDNYCKEQRSKADQHETIVICKKDLHTMRQWFNWIEDVNPKYLEGRDYELVKRVYEALNLPVRDKILEKCK